MMGLRPLPTAASEHLRKRLGATGGATSSAQKTLKNDPFLIEVGVGFVALRNSGLRQVLPTRPTCRY